MKLQPRGAMFLACLVFALAQGCCEKEAAADKPDIASPLPPKTIDIVEKAGGPSHTLPVDEPIEETTMEKVDIAALEAALAADATKETLETVFIEEEPPAAVEHVVADGDKVGVLYTGTLDDGTIFDASSHRGNKPLEFVVGAGQVIPGFDKAVVGMKAGDKKMVHIPCADAYGNLDPMRVIEVLRSQFSAEVKLEAGRSVTMKAPNGQLFRFVVKEVGEDKVKLDGNHPMAGKDLNFEIEVVKVEPGK